MTAFLGELIGTALLVTLGDGVVANVVLQKTKGNAGGLISITLGWAMAVFVAVFSVAAASGAHLNPAITIAFAVLGKFDWALVPIYIAAQLLGAFIGAVVVWVAYRRHFDVTDSAADKLTVFCTGPAIRNSVNNLITEAIGTFVLVFAVLEMVAPASSLGALNALPVALVVLAIGLSLGGPTGYAINPARDLGPRIAHALLPLKNKGTSDWGYSWVPIVGPIIGALIAAFLFKAIS